ncbi:uncharacterized protein LOC135195756 [Macrobrachium nipponense]|uniref:uncharacterized protein LOC135195756 n=1 Tax=Macrobrachium nipponense TaxID=159736 RepID=UPI0030C8AF5B
MWLLTGGIVVLCVVLSTATPVTSGEDSIAQLAETVQNLVDSETEMKDRLLQATNALVESQSALQKLLSGSGKVDLLSVSASKGGEDDMVLKTLADEIMLALRQFRSKTNSSAMPVSRGGSVLQQILDELKDLNGHFQSHLASLACPPPFVMIGQDCYNFILEDMTWANARNACLQIGADLAQPSNVTALKNFVGNRYPRKGRRNFWIGGIYSEKVWQWLSGDLVDDSHWHVNEPSGNGACLAMFDGWENPFSDFPCENERRSICKRF